MQDDSHFAAFGRGLPAPLLEWLARARERVRGRGAVSRRPAPAADPVERNAASAGEVDPSEDVGPERAVAVPGASGTENGRTPEDRNTADAARARTERELRRATREQAAVARLARLALTGRALDELLEEAVRLVAETLDLPFAKVLELLPDEDAFLLKAAVGFPAELVNVGRVPADRRSQAGFTLGSAKPIAVTDFARERRFAIPEILERHGIVSGMSVVIEGVGRPFGVLGAHARRPRSFRRSEMAFLGTIADVLGQVLERRASDEALQMREQEFKTLAEHSPDIVCRFDSSFRYLYVSSEVERTGGMKPEAMIGKTIRELGAPIEHADRFEEGLREAMEEGVSQTLEFDVRRDDGSRRIYECRIVPEPWLPHQRGRTALCVIRNVTEARRAEERIRYQAGLLDAVGEGVAAVDSEGRILLWNRHSERLTGWREEETIGRNVLDVIATPETREELAGLFAHVVAGSGWSGEVPLARRDGSTYPALATAAPIRNEEGKVIGVVGVSTDLTERKLLEEQLRQAQKMEAVGRLAGGVAHDFNNLLTSIAGHADLLRADLAIEDPLREHALEILAAGRRAAGLTRQLLAFSRKQVLRPRVIDLSDVVTNMETLLRRIIGEDIEVSIRCERDLFPVEADVTQVEQVVLNLVVNARDAMPLGGTLVISVGEVEVAQALALEHGDLCPGRYCVVSITDTGTGIPTEVQPHIFEPFFTTKEKGKGTGLGLSTVYGIVRQSGGSIRVDSRPGEGTTVSVYLRALEGACAVTEEPPALQTTDTLGETVLVVEDEAGVRLLMRRYLMRLGYRVMEARNGADALDVWTRHADDVDLVLTDVIMPVMGGGELAGRLRSLAPALPVLFVSGYTDDTLLSRHVLAPEADLLEKPFTLETLARAVRGALESKRSPR